MPYDDDPKLSLRLYGKMKEGGHVELADPKPNSALAARPDLTLSDA